MLITSEHEYISAGRADIKLSSVSLTPANVTYRDATAALKPSGVALPTCQLPSFNCSCLSAHHARCKVILLGRPTFPQKLKFLFKVQQVSRSVHLLGARIHKQII